MPPNELDPERLAGHAQQLADEHEHLTARRPLGAAEIEELGMGALSQPSAAAATASRG